MKLEMQITCICKSAWYHICQISKINCFLMIEQTKSVTHACVTPRIDQPKISLKGLQHVQNACARLIVRAQKHDHITSMLISLHWLLLNRGSCSWFSYLPSSHEMDRDSLTLSVFSFHILLSDLIRCSAYHKLTM